MLEICKKKLGGPAATCARRNLPSCSSGQTNAGGVQRVRYIVRGTSPRAQAGERVSGSAATAAAAPEVSPSHPRVPVIDSSDGRFIRECFRVRRFGRLRATRLYTSSNFQTRANRTSDLKKNTKLREGERERESGSIDAVI